MLDGIVMIMKLENWLQVSSTVKPRYKDTIGTRTFILIKRISLYPGSRDQSKKGTIFILIRLKKAI